LKERQTFLLQSSIIDYQSALFQQEALMAETKTKYGSNNQAITITINGLANDGKRESTAVDNSTNCFFDALVQVKIATNTGADSTSDKCVYVYAYGTSDGGAAYSANASGSDAAFGTDPQQLANGRMIGVIYAPTQNKIYKSDLRSVVVGPPAIGATTIRRRSRSRNRSGAGAGCDIGSRAYRRGPSRGT
jgi:hypothetical protein